MKPSGGSHFALRNPLLKTFVIRVIEFSGVCGRLGAQ
jgi:hypothetical protein